MTQEDPSGIKTLVLPVSIIKRLLEKFVLKGVKSYKKRVEYVQKVWSER